MAKKLETREQLTRHYLDKALAISNHGSIENVIKEVEKIVDCIMRARRCDQNNEFYVAIESELDKESNHSRA